MPVRTIMHGCSRLSLFHPRHVEMLQKHTLLVSQQSEKLILHIEVGLRCGSIACLITCTECHEEIE